MSKFSPKNSSFKSTRFEQNRLIPENRRKPIRIIKESLYSKHVPEAEFTNFLNKSNKGKFEDLMVDFTDNPDWIFEHTLDEDAGDILEATKSILEATHPKMDISKIEFITKTRWRTLNDDSTPFRLFFVLSEDTKTFDLVLIDPMHLSIKSQVQIREKTYTNNKDNIICISDSVGYIKQNIFIRRNNLLRKLD